MKTVLLAYERDEDLATVEPVLRARGHRVLSARTGLEALDAIRHERPDAVVSDVLLPRLDGFALCRRLRDDPDYAHLPFVLHSFRVDGPKYEAFAAQVGAQRFMSGGTPVEEVAEFVEQAPDRSTTLRLRALAPDAPQQAPAPDPALQARLATLEARVAELQTARARVQHAAWDAERAFSAQPTPTWIVDGDSRLVHLASDSTAQLLGTDAPSQRGRPFCEVLPGVEFADGTPRSGTFRWRRDDGTTTDLELERTATTFAGRGAWIVAVRPAGPEPAAAERVERLSRRAEALEAAPEPLGLVDADGTVGYANRALTELMGVDPVTQGGVNLRTLEPDADPDTTLRSLAALGHAALRHTTRWRRPDGAQLEVELAVAPLPGDEGWGVLSVRDVTTARHLAQRGERDQLCANRLLELAHRAHGLTEQEVVERGLALAQELTRSERACAFLAVSDAAPGTLELVAHRHGESFEATQVALARWRGAPAAHSALADCLAGLRPVVRDTPEDTETLVEAGFPARLQRQLAAPLADAGRAIGVLLVTEPPTPYDDDDRRCVAQVAETVSRLVRRRRSDAEVVAAMDHMERVTSGAIESIALLADAHDACKVGRSRRVGEHAARIGAALGLPGHAVRGLKLAGQLIDVGMLHVPRELLWRPTALTPAEYELVKTHPERGWEVLRAIEFPWPVAEVVRQHHERVDGSGYPRGLAGDAILLEARIVAVADAVEAMLAARPHRAPLGIAACVEELQSHAGRRYDARVVKACVRLLREGQLGPLEPGQDTAGEAAAGQRIA
jgi:PAS domain S-box-containing protein